MCTTDEDMNQIASFYTGAMSEAREISLHQVVEHAGALDLVLVFTERPRRDAAAHRGLPRAGRSVRPPTRPSNSPASTRRRCATWWRGRLAVHERVRSALLLERADWERADVLARVGAWVTTLGADGVRIELRDQDPLRIPAVPTEAVAEPTGVGDAFRAGFLAGISHRLPAQDAARLGCVLATEALETVGPQEYTLTPAGLLARLEAGYGAEAARGIAPVLLAAELTPRSGSRTAPAVRRERSHAGSDSGSGSGSGWTRRMRWSIPGRPDCHPFILRSRTMVGLSPSGSRRTGPWLAVTPHTGARPAGNTGRATTSRGNHAEAPCPDRPRRRRGHADRPAARLRRDRRRRYRYRRRRRLHAGGRQQAHGRPPGRHRLGGRPDDQRSERRSGRRLRRHLVGRLIRAVEQRRDKPRVRRQLGPVGPPRRYVEHFTGPEPVPEGLGGLAVAATQVPHSGALMSGGSPDVRAPPAVRRRVAVETVGRGVFLDDAFELGQRPVQAGGAERRRQMADGDGGQPPLWPAPPRRDC